MKPAREPINCMLEHRHRAGACIPRLCDGGAPDYNCRNFASYHAMGDWLCVEHWLARPASE